MNSKIGVVAIITFTLTTGMFASSLALAEQDFSRYSNEEMVQQRSQINNMSKADQVRFQAEMQTRLRHMSEAERAHLGIDGNGQAAQDAQLRQRLNENNDRGHGELRRERLRFENDNGYGRGFGSRQGVSGGGRGR
jgi:hypothetical protein